jgi:hypothetical protein
MAYVTFRLSTTTNLDGLARLWEALRSDKAAGSPRTDTEWIPYFPLYTLPCFSWPTRGDSTQHEWAPWRDSFDSAEALLIGMLRSETAAMACEACREPCEAPKSESRITDQTLFTRKLE